MGSRWFGRTARAAGVSVAVLGLAVGGLALAQTSALTFVAWGGSTQEAQYNAYAPSFTEKTGMAVQQDGPTNYGKVKAMVEANQVTWDVVDVEGEWARLAAKQGLLEELDYNVIDTKGVDPKYYFSHGIASFAFAFVLGYNTNATGGKVPAGWADFFDLEKFPGKRGVMSWSTSGLMEIALLADGVAPDKLYPLDIPRALKKFSTIKDQIVFWDSGAQSQQLLASGETAMCLCWDARVNFLKKDGAPVDMQWNQNVTAADFLVVPKGTKNKEAAMKFIAGAVSPEGMAKMAETVLTNPPNLDAKPLIKPEIWEMLPAAHTESQVAVDIGYWADHSAEIGEAWNKWKVE